MYKPDGNRRWNIFLRCSVGCTILMETENGIFSSDVLLDLQAGWKQKIEYFPPVFSWIYKTDGNSKWNIFLRCSVGSTSRMKKDNGIFSSGVLLDVHVGWKQKAKYVPPVFCWIYKPDGNRNWNIFLRCSVGSASQMETEDGIFSSVVLLDLQPRWKQKMEYFPPVFCWIYKLDGNRKGNSFLRCSVGCTSRMETEMEYFPSVFCWIYKSAGNKK